jgi:hypothetical protein
MKPTVGRIVHVYYRSPVQLLASSLVLRPGIVLEDLGRRILVRVFNYCDVDVNPELPAEEGAPDEYGRYWKWPPRED